MKKKTALILLLLAFGLYAVNAQEFNHFPQLQRKLPTAKQVTGSLVPHNVEKQSTITDIDFHASKSNVLLYGTRIYDDNYSVPYKHIISFNSTNPSVVTPVSSYTDGDNVFRAGEYFDGKYYLYSYLSYYGYTFPENFIVLSTSDWSVISSVAITELPSDMTYDYSTSTMYGIAYAESGDEYFSNLYEINMQTGGMTLVNGLDRYFVTVACDLNGQLYGVDENGFFCTINKQTGVVTQIGATGVAPEYIQSMAFDHNTGRLFWAMCNTGDEGKLMEITNLTTGVATDLGTIAGNAEVIGLYTIYDHTQEDPIVVSTLSPLHSETDVALNAEVSVTFSTDITASDLTGITISPTVSGVSATVNGNKLVIAHDDFLSNTTYTVTVPMGTINNHDQATTWSFTTENTIHLPVIHERDITLYPNPSDGLVYMTVPENSSIKIFDLTGKLIESFYSATNSTVTFSHDVPGIYFVRIDNKGNVITKKFVIR